MVEKKKNNNTTEAVGIFLIIILVSFSFGWIIGNTVERNDVSEHHHYALVNDYPELKYKKPSAIMDYNHMENWELNNLTITISHPENYLMLNCLLKNCKIYVLQPSMVNFSSSVLYYPEIFLNFTSPPALPIMFIKNTIKDIYFYHNGVIDYYSDS